VTQAGAYLNIAPALYFLKLTHRVPREIQKQHEPLQVFEPRK